MAYFDDLSSLAGRTIEKKLREEEEARKRLEQQYREFVSREVKKPTVPAIVPKEQPTVTSTRLQDIYTSGMRPVQQQPTPTRLPAIDPDFAARNPIFASALQQRAKTTRLSDIYGDIPKTPVVPIKEAIGVQRDIARERVTDPALEAFIRRTKPEHIETLERLRRVVQPKPANELAGSVIAGFGDVLSFLGGAAQRVAPEKSALERLGREMTQRGEATAERYGRPSTAADKPLYKAVFDPKFWTRDIVDRTVSVYIDGEKSEMLDNVIFHEHAVYVPLRFVSYELGADVEWNSETRSVYITRQNSQGTNNQTTSLNTAIDIRGTSTFISEVKKALSILKTNAPNKYNLVVNYLSAITETDLKRLSRNSETLLSIAVYINNSCHIDTNVLNDTAKYLRLNSNEKHILIAGILVHEACHMRIEPLGLSNLEQEILSYANQRQALLQLNAPKKLIAATSVDYVVDTNYGGHLNWEQK